MFGSTVYPQVSEYSERRTSIRNSKGFSYLTPCPSIIHPWNRGTNLLQDFVMVTEFSELEGPKPLFVQPSEGIGHFDINAFAVKIMSVDHQPPKNILCNNFTLMEDKQVLFTDIAEGVSAYVYHFLLYDLQARGYVRPFCMAYVSPDSKKLITFYKEIHKAFSKISSDLKIENLKLFALEMSHQLQDLEYSLNCLNQKSDGCSVITNDNTASASDTPTVTVQSLEYLRQETLNILEALEEYKPELFNDYAAYRTKANVKYNPTCKDSSHTDDSREDGPVALAVQSTIDSDQLANHHNVNHDGVGDDKSCNDSNINKNNKISKDVSTNVEHDKHIPNNLTSSHQFHRGRMKSKHKDPPIDEQYVVVNNVDRSFSCSDISSCEHLSKEASNRSESSSQSSESVVPCSSESEFSFASSSSFQQDNSSHEDSSSVILDRKSDKTSHLFLIDYPSNYKPKLYKPPSRKRFEFMLRKLELMCLNRYDHWKQLESIHQYYSQDLAILKMHQWEKNLTEPTSSLLTFGGCVTSNFLHGMHRCYCEKERGMPKHQLISNQMKKLSFSEDQPAQFNYGQDILTSFMQYTLENFVFFIKQLIITIPKEVVSRVSSLPDRYHFPQGCTNVAHPTSLPISSQPSEEWDIITSTSEGDHDISIETSYESTSLYSTCSEHSDDMLCALCQQPNKDASTYDGSLGSLDGSDESFHSTSSVQSFPCGNTRLNSSKKSFMLLADVINSKKHLLQAKNLMYFLSQYDNINNVVASLLSGRTVAVVGSCNSEEKVKDIVEALSLFVPGNFINHKKVVIPWLKRQLQLKDLTSFRLVGLSKRKNNTIPRSIMNYVSILDLEKRVVCAPIYEGKIVNSLLRQLQLFQNNPAAYLAYIHSHFQEISSTAFLYYHSFCMTSANPKASASYIGLDRLAREFRDTSQQFLKTWNIVQDDRKIIEFLASLILKQVLEEAQEKGAWIGNREGSNCSFHVSYKPSCTRKC
ncbi:guanine nucleotide exchange protein SMCR8 isoform X2 [Octopus sinensis]|uniref:Guanine nucleotide exchange protein SMCR8 isoform X2 n=1 Tax=Octopus sinensis TaxID=2607531 RepID=A0A7E6FR86_9MOLL|nr:guanine nucleotide exchange protein SMCR8 isoform X2 [Octopus sinensis]